MPKKVKGVYRNGKIHVAATMCDTCIFRPGNLMDLQEDRVEGMIAEATEKDSCIPCHKTTYGQAEGEAVCRGFYELRASAGIRLGMAFGIIEFQEIAK